MLNKNQSNKWNSWKYVSVFPVLATFVFIFQIEVIAQEKVTQKSEKNLAKEDMTSIIITKNTTDEEIKNYCEELKKTHDIDLTFFNIKRNQNGEIINIKSEFKNKTSSGSCEASDNPIKPFKFYFDVNKKEIGYNMDLKTVLEEKEILMNGQKSSQEESDKLDQNTVDKVDVNTLENTIRITTEEGKPLIIIDGIKKDSDFKMEDLDPAKIESINVLKGHHATMKYNESGKNGVLEITTKEKIGKNEFKSLQSKTVQGFQLLKFNDKKDVATDKIDFIITKNTTDEEIKEKCEQIKNLYNIDLNFFNIKRNGNGEITNIESNNSVFPRSYKQSQNPIETFKFFYKKKANKGFNSGYARLSNSISRIMDDKNIDYKKAIIIIDGKQSDYQDLEKVNPSEVKRVMTKDIKSKSSEAKKYFELYGEKALYGFLIEIQTNEYYNKNN